MRSCTLGTNQQRILLASRGIAKIQSWSRICCGVYCKMAVHITKLTMHHWTQRVAQRQPVASQPGGRRSGLTPSLPTAHLGTRLYGKKSARRLPVKQPCNRRPSRGLKRGADKTCRGRRLGRTKHRWDSKVELYCRYQRLAVREGRTHDHEFWEQDIQYFAANEHATFVPFCLRPARRAGLTFMNQWINQLINQSINQSINQLINQSINQSMNQSITQSIN